MLRGENILKGYYKNEAATTTAFRNGWFQPASGYRDADGFYYIVDRKSDMIIRGAKTLPREIDEVHISTGSGRSCYYRRSRSAVRRRSGGVCRVEAGREVTEEEIIAFCRGRLADFKCPKTVRIVTEIPKGPTGKLLKRELARELVVPPRVRHNGQGQVRANCRGVTPCAPLIRARRGSRGVTPWAPSFAQKGVVGASLVAPSFAPEGRHGVTPLQN